MAESTSSDHRPPSGYEEDFMKEVEEDFQCPICHLPLEEPVLTRCGHRYCKECLDEHIGRQKSKEESLTCPTDRENLDPDLDIFPDKATERRVLSMAIRCPNDGCEWTGELRNKEMHLESCPFQQVACANKNCHEKVQRRHLTQHENNVCLWRILQCTYCTEPHPDYMMQSHIRQCSKFPVTCPNSCGRSIPRDMVSNHTKDECPLTIISCPHEGMGCTTKVQRQGMEYHLESATTIHLDLVCIKLNNTEDKLNKTEDELNNTKDKLNKTADELNNTKDKLKKTEALLNETRVELQNAIELLRLSSENETGEIVGKKIPSFARPKTEENKGWGLLNFISHLKLHSRRYIVDNTLFLQVEISSPSNTNSSLEG